MPAFVANGPDIPEHLMQAHEEGRVVFFCGAGISCPAGLPDFCGLVDQTYERLGSELKAIEKQAYEKEQYDAVLDLLERRYPGHRHAVRTALAEVLKPNLHRKGAKKTHQALVQLATDREEKVRLVTSNFDRIFEHVMSRPRSGIPSFVAPLLPIPKPSRWHGVVYLHGLLPKTPDENALNRLVLTSGDFGMAYLTERWAARFVTDLFRNYIVCFVGYRINDPVLRYMMDALAADELLGEARNEAYAFAGFSDGKQEEELLEWEAKGVTPLLYEVPVDTQDHSALHRTLQEWANTYRDGAGGKEMIIAQHATNPPQTASRSDFAVGRVLWALTDELAAKRFARLNPVPPLEWLQPLSETQFGHRDLLRFGVTPNIEVDGKLSFSALKRPGPYTRAPWMSIADAGTQSCGWDQVMHYLACWLLRHLNDPKLVLWLIRQGGRLNDRFVDLVRWKIGELDRLSEENRQKELNRILRNAPNAIPDPFMRTLWRLFLTGRIKSNRVPFDPYGFVRRLKQEGLTPTMRLELRDLLAPRVALREAFCWDENAFKTIRASVDCDVVLTADHVHSALGLRENAGALSTVLPSLLEESRLLLRDALYLMRELGQADDKSDYSHVHQPSIADHPQNNTFHDWTVLIELTRDAWLVALQTNPIAAKQAAESWMRVPYPLFKRLSFFAAANSDILAPREALAWLLTDDCWWLWSTATQREALRLLVKLSPKLDSRGIVRLERAVLQGPPREMFEEDIDPEDWLRIVGTCVWLRLAKMQAAGAQLRPRAKTRLQNLAKQYPGMERAEDESDEFSFWVDTEYVGVEIPPRGFAPAPEAQAGLVNWLDKHAHSDHTAYKDSWRERCHSDVAIAAGALADLADKNQWSPKWWRVAMETTSEDALLPGSWPKLAQILVKAPDELLADIAHSLSRWLEKQAKSLEGNSESFIALIGRLLDLDLEGVEKAIDDPLNHALNHPVGIVAEALLRWWYRGGLKNAQGLEGQMKCIVTRLCDTDIGRFRPGRVLLATRAIPLFRVDQDWANTNLLPLFDWKRSQEEARAVWSGFLRSPRLHRPFLEAIKQPLLDTAAHCEQLRKHSESYATFLAFAALDSGDAFSMKELRVATGSLSQEDLDYTAGALARALEGSGKQRSEYWHNRIQPYFHSIWPKSDDRLTPAISASLAQLCLAAGNSFPEALQELQHWLQHVEYPGHLLVQIREAKLCELFPLETLKFLDTVIDDEVLWHSSELQESLAKIEKANPKLAKRAAYKRLVDSCRKNGTA